MKQIFNAVLGSHAYGTNTTSSDIDYRGIFVADRKYTTQFFNTGQYNDPNEKDSVSYELNKFMKLYSEGNPNIIELLWVDESNIITDSAAYQLLRKNRSELLSSNVVHTFCGYSRSQLKAMKNQSKWENNPRDINPPKQTDYVSLVVNFTADKMFQINIEDFQDGHQLVHYGGNIYGLYQSKGHSTFTKTFHLITNSEHFEHTDSDGNRRIPLHVIKFNIQEYQQTLDDWTNYWNWRNLKDKKVQLYGMIENELAQRNSEARTLIEGQLTIDQVVAVDDMVELLKTMQLDNLTDLLHLCKRHLDFKAVGVDCYSEDTEFLTENGWKLYKDISDEELIGTFNTESMKVEMQPIIERCQNLYTGNMYHIFGTYQDTMVTSNHRMFFRKQERNTGKIYDKWEFTQACKLPDYFEVVHHLVPKSSRHKLPEGINTNIFKYLDMHNYLRVIGWYVSEGSSYIDKTNKLRYVTISQSKPRSVLTQNMTKLRNSGKIKCCHKIHDKGIGRYPENIWTFRGEVAEILVDECSRLSKNIHLPKWVFELSGRELNILLTALLQGDGTKRPDGSYVYSTTSKQLADEVQRLCVMAGHASHITGPYTTDNILHNPSYGVHLWKHPEPTKRVARCENISKVPVVNAVTSCFMVKNGTLITRRNGKVAYHGNCKHGMHLVRLLRMCREILEDGVVNVRRKDFKELLEIRNGSWTYDQLIAYGEEQDKYIREVAYPNTTLRKKPNIELATDLILKIQDMMWTKA